MPWGRFINSRIIKHYIITVILIRIRSGDSKNYIVCYLCSRNDKVKILSTYILRNLCWSSLETKYISYTSIIYHNVRNFNDLFFQCHIRATWANSNATHKLTMYPSPRNSKPHASERLQCNLHYPLYNYAMRE